MNKMDKIMAAMLILFAASIVSMLFMWSPMHHLGMGAVWLAFIVIVVLLVSDKASNEKSGKRRRRR